MQHRDLVLIDRARAALEEARTIPEVAELRDQAVAMHRYLKRKQGAELAAARANEIRLRAERKLGDLAGPAEHGGDRKSNRVAPLDDGLSAHERKVYRRIASIPEPEFEEALAAGAEATTAGLVRLAKTLRKVEKQNGRAYGPGTCTVQSLETLTERGHRFGTIYADPPWPYSNRGTRGAAGDHYETPSLEWIRDLPVEKVAADASHLHLWTTNAFLRDAFDVIEAWGFEYKSCFVWVKPKIGMGNYWRVSHEFLLLGVRGALSFADKAQRSWMEHEIGKHSRKPDRIREVIEKVSPGPRLELFGREAVEGWAVWGNQVDQDLFYATAEALT